MMIGSWEIVIGLGCVAFTVFITLVVLVLRMTRKPSSPPPPDADYDRDAPTDPE